LIYVDVPFPDCIALGAESNPMWSTNISASFSGEEIANQNWEEVRHAYELSLAVRTATDYLMVKDHFMLMRGRAKSFPFKDYLDFEALSGEGFTVVADDPSDGYQLLKRYGTGGDAYDRRITRPIGGTLTIYRTRSAVTTDVTGSATVDLSGGTVNISGHVGGDTYTWKGEFYVPCRYDVDRLPGAAVNRQPGDDGELLVSCDSIPVVEVKE
jgi:uncharacterized protein (TIGR02217 family)